MNSSPIELMEAWSENEERTMSEIVICPDSLVRVVKNPQFADRISEDLELDEQRSLDLSAQPSAKDKSKMTVETTFPPMTIPPKIAEILTRQNAEEEFRITAEAIARWFPETIAIRPFVFGDPEDRERWLVMMRIILPHTINLLLVAEHRSGYDAELLGRLLPPSKRTCTLYVDFTDTPHALE
jgi:hypothetical protein